MAQVMLKCGTVAAGGPVVHQSVMMGGALETCSAGQPATCTHVTVATRWLEAW
jgi:hypothetical protein